VKIVRPDFVFFSSSTGGKVVVDIVDPHGTHLSDALPKLRGMARYAKTHSSLYRRIECVAAISARLRALDLTDPKVQMAVENADDAASLYAGPLAVDYT